MAKELGLKSLLAVCVKVREAKLRTQKARAYTSMAQKTIYMYSRTTTLTLIRAFSFRAVAE